MQETLRETRKILDELEQARKILNELRDLTDQVEQKLDSAAQRTKDVGDD